jgi:N-acetylglucosaminyl-diphospho-decaprenol L-rhamnosyltransferase
MVEDDLAATLAILVVNYGSSDLLAQNLVEVSAHAPGARVVVVDNLTTVAERDRVAALCTQHGWHAILMDHNAGFGGAVNHAAAVALGPDTRTLLLLNPDAVLDGDSLARLLRRVEQDPLTLAAPLVRNPDGGVWSAGSDLYLDRGEMRGWRHRDPATDPATRQPWLSGACLMVSRELWERVGGFDEDYFLYWEDADLCRRALALGATLVLDEDAVAVHDAGSTSRAGDSRRAKSAVYYYYNTRNRLLFAAKHLSPDDQRRWRRTSAAVAYQVLLRGGRRQFRHPSRNVLPALRGTRDGLALMRRHRTRA